MKKKIQAMQSGTAERETSNREWRRPREFPRRALTTCTPSHPFSSTTPYIVQLEWLTSIPQPNSIITIILYSSVTRDKTFHDVDHFGLDKIKNWLIEYLAAVRLKERNADKETWEAAPITVACEEPAQQWNCCPIDASKPTLRAPLPVIYLSLEQLLFYLLPFPNLAHHCLFVGPLGTGKISLSQSIACALGHPF